MPGFDQSGPQGQGPMTGRGLGPCAMPVGRQGRGMGLGRGNGRGYGRFAGRSYLTKGEEVEDLEGEAKDLEADLKALKERIAEIRGE